MISLRNYYFELNGKQFTLFLKKNSIFMPTIQSVFNVVVVYSLDVFLLIITIY